MKKILSILTVLALTLTLIIGMASLAENATTEPETQPEIEQPAEETTEEDAEPAEDAEVDGAAALLEALETYKAAKQSDKLEALEEELNGYVESGKLTREQADLILKYYQESLSQKGIHSKGGHFSRSGQKDSGSTRSGNRGSKQQPSIGRGGKAGGTAYQQAPEASDAGEVQGL